MAPSGGVGETQKGQKEQHLIGEAAEKKRKRSKSLRGVRGTGMGEGEPVQEGQTKNVVGRKLFPFDSVIRIRGGEKKDGNRTMSRHGSGESWEAP